ncbi:MAG: TonB family protein [Cyclobacteriaceae bacterium]
MNDRKNDIAKYLKGELSPAEMHKLEMRALEDPFLADALEGTDLTTPEQFAEDVIFLNQKIQKNNKRYYWPLRIAASIILVISITYLVFQITPERSNDSLALKKEIKSEEATTGSEQDSTQSSKDNFKNKEIIQAIEDKPIAKTKSLPKEIAKNDQVPLPASQALREATTSATQAELENTEFETITEDVSPITQDVEILEREEIAQLKTETRRIRSDALKKSASPSTLSGAGNKEMKSTPTNSISARPIIGEDEYREYLNDNVQYPKEAVDNRISGEVTVSFLVDTDGNSSDFNVEKGIGFGCDQELIRLIENGPKWMPAKNDGVVLKEKVSVKFVFQLPN